VATAPLKCKKRRSELQEKPVFDETFYGSEESFDFFIVSKKATHLIFQYKA
jgi:hypothetical protein